MEDWNWKFLFWWSLFCFYSPNFTKSTIYLIPVSYHQNQQKKNAAYK